MAFGIDWKAIGLRENPFAISPPSNPDAAAWADMSALRDEFNRVLREAKGSAPTQVILCRGPVGGGKTHASLYFSSEKNWPEQEPSVQRVHVLRVPTPKEVGKPDRDFYTDVMDTIGAENIRDSVRAAIDMLGREHVLAILRGTVLSPDIAKALVSLGDTDENPLVTRYFFGKCSATELRKLGLNRNIEKTQDYFRVLAGVILCHIGLADSRTLSEHTRFCLWLDEMEDFIYFSPAQYRPFGQGLRELVDRLPSFFSLFLNFTLTSPEEYEEIELILGNYLIDRVTQQIFFDEMVKADQLEYVQQLLSFYRHGDFGSMTIAQDNLYYPFEEEALSMLLFEMPRRTPRNVNKRCRTALVKAFEEGLFVNKGHGIINSDFVRRMSKEELDTEVG